MAKQRKDSEGQRRSGQETARSPVDTHDGWRMSTGLKVQVVTWIVALVAAIAAMLLIRPYLP
jgi:hypothetical protein